MTAVSRFRAPHKVHVLSWALALEREGSVSCHFKDCQFMALSVEEMGNHYPFCTCENSKYSFVCEICSRRTDALEKLVLHKIYSHSYKPTDEESEKITHFQNLPIKKEITPILKRSWEIFLEKKKYLKCLLRPCLYVTSSMEDMENHYLSFCKEEFWHLLKYVCEFCYGRVTNVIDLDIHIKTAHESKTYLIANTIVPDNNINCVELWSRDILIHKQGKCFVEGCRFVDNNVKILEKHYASCNGKKKNVVVCCACGCWLQNENRLNEHRRCFHKDLDDSFFSNSSQDKDSDNRKFLLFDEISPDENDPLSEETDLVQRLIEMKKYNGASRIPRICSNSSLSPVFPAKNTECSTESIDCKSVADRSGIQYDTDIIKTNECSLDVIDIDRSSLQEVLNNGMTLQSAKKPKPRRAPTGIITPNKVNENYSADKIIHQSLPTPLQALGNAMLKENKNTSTVPVQIKVNDTDWTVNVSETVVSQTKSSEEFPKNREELFKHLKEESYRLLKLVSRKNSIRNDVRMVFDPNENRVTPFHINFKYNRSVTDGGLDSDNLDMSKYLSSDESSEDSLSDDSSSDAKRASINDPCNISIEKSDNFPSTSNENVSVCNENDNSCTQENTIEVHEDNMKEEENDLNEVTSNFSDTDDENDLITETENGIKTEDSLKYNLLINERENILVKEETNQNGEVQQMNNLSPSEAYEKNMEVENQVKEENVQNIYLERTNVLPTQISVLSETCRFEEEDESSIITVHCEDVATGVKFESEYIIPEIDFVDNASFKSSNEKINLSDSFQDVSSDSVHHFSHNNGENTIIISIDEASEDDYNKTAHDKGKKEYIDDFKSNEEIVIVDNELSSSSFHCLVSDTETSDQNHVVEKDPLNVDDFVRGNLFNDPDMDCGDSDLLHPYDKHHELDISSEHEGEFSNGRIDHDLENTNNTTGSELLNEDFQSTNTWNWSNLKKYSKSAKKKDSFMKIGNSPLMIEKVNKNMTEEDKFIGFSNSIDSSNKYFKFVNTCNKLGFYNDMVVFNQHYQISPSYRINDQSFGIKTSMPTSLMQENSKLKDISKRQNRNDLLSEGLNHTKNKSFNDENEEFLGFESNEKYDKLRRDSIELSRRLSAEFSDCSSTCYNGSTNENGEDDCYTPRKHKRSQMNKRKKETGEVESVNQRCSSRSSISEGGESDVEKLNSFMSGTVEIIQSKHNIDSNKVISKECQNINVLGSVPKKRGRPRKNSLKISTFSNSTSCINELDSTAPSVKLETGNSNPIYSLNKCLSNESSTTSLNDSNREEGLSTPTSHKSVEGCCTSIQPVLRKRKSRKFFVEAKNLETPISHSQSSVDSSKITCFHTVGGASDPTVNLDDDPIVYNCNSIESTLDPLIDKRLCRSVSDPTIIEPIDNSEVMIERNKIILEKSVDNMPCIDSINGVHSILLENAEEQLWATKSQEDRETTNQESFGSFKFEKPDICENNKTEDATNCHQEDTKISSDIEICPESIAVVTKKEPECFGESLYENTPENPIECSDLPVNRNPNQPNESDNAKILLSGNIEKSTISNYGQASNNDEGVRARISDASPDCSLASQGNPKGPVETDVNAVAFQNASKSVIGRGSADDREETNKKTEKDNLESLARSIPVQSRKLKRQSSLLLENIPDLSASDDQTDNTDETNLKSLEDEFTEPLAKRKSDWPQTSSGTNSCSSEYTDFETPNIIDNQAVKVHGETISKSDESINDSVESSEVLIKRRPGCLKKSLSASSRKDEVEAPVTIDNQTAHSGESLSTSEEINNSLVICSEVLVKKRLGRPKKSFSVSSRKDETEAQVIEDQSPDNNGASISAPEEITNNSVDCSESLVKRKPGRPKKSHPSVTSIKDEAETSDNIEDQPVDNNGASISTHQEIASNSVECSELLVKRQPGRPKKSRPSVTSIKNEEDTPDNIEDQPVDSNGASASTHEKIASNSVECSELLVKRKPGRPKKSGPSETSIKDETDTPINIEDQPVDSNGVSGSTHEEIANNSVECSELLVKRKPGRPKKSYASVTSIKDETDTPITIEDQLVDNNGAPVSTHEKIASDSVECPELLVKRKRGRPKKSHPSVTSIKDEADIPDNIEDQPVDNNGEANSISIEITPKRKPGRPKKSSLSVFPRVEGTVMTIENQTMHNNGLKEITSTSAECSEYLSKTKPDVTTESDVLNAEVTGNGALSQIVNHNHNGSDRSTSDQSLGVSISTQHVINDPVKCPEVLVKRKPGRPKKSSLSISSRKIEVDTPDIIANQTVLSNVSGEAIPIPREVSRSSVECSEVLVKRGPGRPKKSSLSLLSRNEGTIAPVTIDNKTIHNDGDSDKVGENITKCSIECSEVVVKRKRGRPKKSIVSVLSGNDGTVAWTAHDNGNVDILDGENLSNSVRHTETGAFNFGNITTSTPITSLRDNQDMKNHLNESMALLTPRGHRTRLGKRYSTSPYASNSFDSASNDWVMSDEMDPPVCKKKRGRQKGFKVTRNIEDEKNKETESCVFEKNYICYNDTASEENIHGNDPADIPKEYKIITFNFTLNHPAFKTDENSESNEVDMTSESPGDVNDDGLSSKQMARMAKRKLLSGRVDALTKLRKCRDLVKCAICGKIMKVLDYQKVHLPKHNYVAWLEGEEPLPTDDFDAMETLLTRGKRMNPRFVYRCEICNLEKKSARGYLSHRQFCGKTEKEKESLMVSCNLCGRLMIPASIPAHMYQSHKSVDSSNVDEIVPVRKAAEKCLGKIALYIEEQGPPACQNEDIQPDIDGDEEFDDIEEITLLYAPVQKRRPSKNMVRRWRFYSAENREMTCPFIGCTFKTESFDEMLKHHKICAAGGSQGFSCIKCNYVSKVEDEIREHVKSCNPPIIVSQSESEDEGHDRNAVIPFLKMAEHTAQQRYKSLFFQPALSWMKRIYDTQFSHESLYPDFPFNSNSWGELDVQFSKIYNPQTSESMRISFVDSSYSWESMPALSGKVLEGNQGVAYTGGPIWGLQWCPGEGDQYIAVSSHLTMESNFQAGSTFTGPGLVQLWSLNDINNSKNDSLTTLELSYAICHNEGACWNIAWCPSGGRTDTRIGLLALATTSGSIPIYAMPHPQCLQSQTTRFYKPDPVLKLELWSNERWQCSSISWSKSAPHKTIVAGFVNGIVAVWDIETQQKLLRKKTTLLPFHVFQAHNSMITGLCLSPESDNYLATASYDKSFKYWDLNDTTSPHSVLKRGLFTSVSWLRHWMSTITTYDNAYTMLQTSLSLSTLRGFVNPTMQVVNNINSTSWDVSVNDWLNGAISSYDNGQVLLFLALKQTSYQNVEKRKFTKIILQSSLHNLNEEGGNSNESDKKDNDVKTQRDIPSNSYKEAIAKYGLSIKTNPVIKKADKVPEKCPESKNDIYPLTSINRVAWNTNKQSFLYVAMGYQSGFLVVSKLSFPTVDQNLIEEVMNS